MDNSAPPVGKKLSLLPSLPKAMGYGVLLVVVDAFLLNQGGIAVLVVVYVFIKALIAIIRNCFFELPFPKQLLRNYAIYVAAAALVLGLNISQNILAQHRAENVVTAIEAYHAKYGNYPQSLETVVPEFLDRVPLAKYAHASSSFYYRKIEGRGPTFFYIIFPPFYRNFYNFEKREWFAMD